MLLLYLFKIPLKYVLTVTNSLLQVLTVAGLIGRLGLLAVRNVFTIAEGLVPTQLRALEENIVSGSISKLETAQTAFVKVTQTFTDLNISSINQIIFKDVTTCHGLKELL